MFSVVRELLDPFSDVPALPDRKWYATFDWPSVPSEAGKCFRAS